MEFVESDKTTLSNVAIIGFVVPEGSCTWFEFHIVDGTNPENDDIWMMILDSSVEYDYFVTNGEEWEYVEVKEQLYEQVVDSTLDRFIESAETKTFVVMDTVVPEQHLTTADRDFLLESMDEWVTTGRRKYTI
jgi:hypothetical protein